MQKTYKHIGAIALAMMGFLMSGCAGDNLATEAPQPTGKQTKTVTLTIGFDDSAKTRSLTSAGVKTFKAKGRRVTNWEVSKITEVEPREPAPVEETTPTVATTDEAGDETPSPDGISQDEVLDSFTVQQRIHFDEV